MKQTFFVFALFLSIGALSAQDSTHVHKLTSRQQDLDRKFAKFSPDRIAIDLLGANWIYNPNQNGINGMRTRWFSRGMDIYFYWDFHIKHSRISVAPGIGYSLYTVNTKSQMIEDSAGIHFQPLDNPSNYKAVSLTLQYIDIPVELRIRSNPDKFDNMFKVCVGFKAGVRVDVNSKETVKDVAIEPNLSPYTNTEKVQNLHRYPDFNPYRFGPTLRMGYSVFNVVAFYDAVPVFKTGRGPKANDFSLGISFNGL